MDGIYGWIITIVAAVLIFNLADILMPNGNVKRISGAVIGIVIVAMIINPIVSIVGGQDISSRIEGYQSSFSEFGFDVTYDNKSYGDYA